MLTQLLQRLFRRSKRPVSPAMASWLVIAGQYSAIEADIASDPAMCRPMLSKPTARITRVIDDGETIAAWNDNERTLTMETAVVGV